MDMTAYRDKKVVETVRFWCAFLCEVMEALSSKFRSLTPGKTGEASGKRSQAFEYVLKYSGRFTTEKQYANIILRSNQMVKS
jgi:hypothetical protein